MNPNRAMRRAEKQRLWREANRLYHEEETLTGKKRLRLVLTSRKRRIAESKISRWIRRAKKVTPTH